MTFKSRIMRTAAASCILLAASTLAASVFSPVIPAQAATNVSININVGTFYDRLQPYGNWVFYQDRYVWLPVHVDRGWRPYTRGHWAYTHRYGWLWVSNERFGWATYHYGRWGYSRELGWYWVPGRRWAPAWVVWSRADNEIAWAPLPPRHGNDVDISITIGDIPDYYWQAVPVTAFLSLDLSGQVIHDRDRVRTVVQQGTPETVRIENNIVINNVIEVNSIEKATNTQVKVLEEKAVNSPEAVGKVDTNSVTIFNPEVKDEANVKPKKILKVEEVVTERKAKGIKPEDQPADQTVAPVTVAPVTVAPVAPVEGKDKNGKPIIKTDQPDAKTQQPADIQQPDATAPIAETPVVKPKKDKALDTLPADTGNATADAPVDKSKKKKDAGANDQQTIDQKAAVPADTQTPPANGKKKKKKAEQPANSDGQGKVICDPNVQDCPPVQ